MENPKFALAKGVQEKGPAYRTSQFRRLPTDGSFEKVVYGGEKLQKEVYTFWKEILENKPSTNPLIDAFAHNLDRLPASTWREPRTEGQVKTFYMAMCTAVQHAYLMTERRLVPQSHLSSEADSLQVIDTVLSDPDKKGYFAEGIWRTLTTFIPERGIAPYHVIQHHFPNRSITGIDIGEGPGLIFPLMMSNSPRYTTPDFPGKEVVPSHSGVQIDFGLGIDMHNREENQHWAYANPNSWLSRPGMFEDIVEEIAPVISHYPHLTLDITQQDALEQIHSTFRLYNQAENPQVITSIFMGYQVPQDKQHSLGSLVTALLPDGGIWIDIGEEFMLPRSAWNERYNVNVYKKEGKELTGPNIPFVIDEKGDILETNADYFFAT